MNKSKNNDKSNGKQGIYRVFYARFPFDVTYALRTALDQVPPVITVASLEKTHIFLFEVLGTSIENVFWQMQGENWSPRGEARPLIEKLRLRHTSMSIGDVVQAPGGWFYICQPSGWKEMQRQ
jgi:hypothetical protein